MQTPQPGLPDPLDVRCSDADRERTADVLREAATDGRLALDELEDRLQATFSAKTFRELVPITQDLGSSLPRLTHSSDPVPAIPAGRVGGVATGTSAVAVFGGATRRGQWVLPTQFVAFALFGGVDLDLREARFVAPEVTIIASAVFGGIDIVVPDDVIVQVDGMGLFGGYDSAPGGNPPPGAPVVRVRGVALFGGVSIKRKPSRRQKEIGEGSHD